MSRGLFWDSFRRSLWLQATAVLLIVALVVVQCGREGAIHRSMSDLNYDSLPEKAPRPTRPAEKLNAAAGELESLLAVQAREDLSDEETNKARSARARVTGELKALDREFDANRAKLEDLDAEAALARLDEIEARTAKLGRSLQAALASVPTNGKRASAPAGEAREVLAALSPDRPQQPLSTGFGSREAEDQPASLSAGITPAYAAPTATDAPSDLPRAPEEADLEETAETKATPAIHALAEKLDRDPVKVYGYVRNQIEYKPYHGIRKDADQTLRDKAGSGAEQAALLIALLRDSGIHARFVQGTAELPAARAANWLGLDTAAGQRLDAVPDILSSGGIPTTEVRTNGQLIKVRFDHIWAEAYVPHDAYRGVDEQRGGRAWLPLDPSVKQNEFRPPAFDFDALLQPRIDAFVESYANSIEKSGDDGFLAPTVASVDAEGQELLDDARSVLADHGIGEDAKPEDIVGATRIRQASPTYLPASTPFRTTAIARELRALPSALHASVTVSVSGADPLSAPTSSLDDTNAEGFTYSAPTSELVNKRITVAYVPATAEDAAIIDAYHGLLNAPTYAAALIPVLRVDGRVVARGHRAVSTGYTQSLKLTYRMPGFASDVVENPVSVGSLSALALAVGPVVTGQLKDRALRLAALSDTTSETFLTDARGGEFMAILGSLYFARNDRFDTVTAKRTGIDQQRLLSGGIVASDIGVSYVAGFPVSSRFDGLYMDVDEDSHALVATKGDATAKSTYLRMVGMHASESESAVFSHALGGGAVSTAVVIGEAAARGVPLMKIDASNVGRLESLVQASTSVKQEIVRSIAGGATVYIPASESTIEGWTGAGYIVDRGTSIGFRISGGFNGSARKRKLEVASADANRMAVWAEQEPPPTEEEDESGAGAWLYAELLIGFQLLALGALLTWAGAPAFITVTLLVLSIALFLLFAYKSFKEYQHPRPTDQPPAN